MDKKTTPTHVVIDKDYIQQLPEMEKPKWTGRSYLGRPYVTSGLQFDIFKEKEREYEKHVASLPKILRADEGKWEIGQQLTEHVDFQKHWYNHGGFDKPDHYDWAAIPLEAPAFEVKWSMVITPDQEILAVFKYKEWAEQWRDKYSATSEIAPFSLPMPEPTYSNIRYPHH
jgi:hypothetical protein